MNQPSLLIAIIDVYKRQGLGLNVPNQTLGSDKLNLTDVEKKALISFMKTLTDTIGTTTLPDKLPSFPDQSGLNQRTIGGEY